MCKVLVFSKNRPMQLHAYLQSILHDNYIKYKDISVLYYNDYPFNYDNVIDEFSEINWIKEYDFDYQLREWILNCTDEFIMFGCDDVVFTHQFNVKYIEYILRTYEDIFGFSLRLGTNIKGFPDDAIKEKKICHWKWDNNKWDDFHYPWELDCTVYRTSDVIDIISKYPDRFINPNYFEEFVALDWNYYIKRPELACYDSISKAIVITINRVQDTHPNYYDDNCPSLEQLNELYQNGHYMDIRKISKKENDVVHVGAEYLIMWSLYDGILRLSQMLSAHDQYKNGIISQEEFVRRIDEKE